MINKYSIKLSIGILLIFSFLVIVSLPARAIPIQVTNGNLNSWAEDFDYAAWQVEVVITSALAIVDFMDDYIGLDDLEIVLSLPTTTINYDWENVTATVEITAVTDWWFGVVPVWDDVGAWVLDLNTWAWTDVNGNEVFAYDGDTPDPLPSETPSPTPPPPSPTPPAASPTPPAASPTPPTASPTPPTASPTASPPPPAPSPTPSSGPPPLPSPQTISTTTTAQALSTTDFMDMFFNDPGDKDLSLYIPGYAYFQGVLYSNGNVQALGPIRVIGGIISQRQTPGDPNPGSIKMEKGAMLTTNPEYIEKRFVPPNTKLRIVKWKEIPSNVKERE